jgi:hypothetical protein
VLERERESGRKSKREGNFHLLNTTAFYSS